MAAGKVGRGGKGSRAGGSRGAGGAGKASKASFPKVDGTGGVGGVAGAAGGVAGAGAAGPVDPLTAQALEIARQLRAGLISSRDEATKKLVDHILRRKLRMQSAAISGRIADALTDDPNMSQTLERIWAKG